MGRSTWQVVEGIDVVDGTDSSEDTGKGMRKVRVLVEQFDRSSSCLHSGTSARRITEPLIMTTTTMTTELLTVPLAVRLDDIPIPEFVLNPTTIPYGHDHD